jgi:signal transduction histidine kinase
MTLRRSDVALDDEQRAGLLDVVSGEADRLARTVNDILWASRLEGDRLEIAIDPIDASELTRRVIEAQKAHLPPDIWIELGTDGAVPLVAADADKLHQVLTNLIENGVKYSPDGGRIELRIEPQERHVRFSVRDEGIGIPPHEQRRIFEKFYRLDPNLTRGVGGTGLGLYICRELVRRMNGRIWVASREGEGSTFFFELPLAETVPA